MNTSTNIIYPCDFEQFDFNNLTLESPIAIPGNAFFTKILYVGRPLIIQTSHSTTKQGIIKMGKKFNCDLVFDNSSELIIKWFENLEDKCKSILLEKNSIWFENPLSENDVDEAFISIIKVFKSGKLYLIRTSLKSHKDTEITTPDIKIYNESYTPYSMENITSESKITCFLEIKGIKFTSKKFQIDMEIKQIMIFEDDKILDNCLISKEKPY